MNIEKFETRDLEFLTALQPPDWMDITPHFRYYLQSANCFPVRVMLDGQLVGVGTSILHQDTAWLAHIIVHPGFRNRNIGGTLTRALIDSVDNSIFKTVYLIATVLGEPVYTKLGFVPENEQLFFNEGRPFSQYAIPAGIIPYHADYLEVLLQMDREVSGEHRAKRISEHLSDAFVYISGKTIQGYYLPGLGEGSIVAKDREAGIQLMQYRLQNHSVAIVPAENSAGVDFLLKNGFKIFRKAKRMRLGEKRTWHPEYIYNRVSGQIG